MTANYVLLEKITVGAAGAVGVTFSNIPQTGYTDLAIRVSARSSGSYKRGVLLCYFNGSTSNLTYRRLYGVPAFGGTPGSDAGSNSTTSYFSGNTSTSNTFGNDEIYIPNYTSSNFKSYSSDGVSEDNSNEAGTTFTANLWSSTAAITSITLADDQGNSFAAGSTFYLYGVAKLGTTPAISPKATGGDIIETDGTYWYHAFLSSGTFTPTVGLSCDILVAAGGGGGGRPASGAGFAGGGGAGGVLGYATQSIASGSAQTITIGAGGGINTSGSNSQFGSLTASTGGGAGGGFNVAGSAGGNGGGGGENSAGGTGSQGFNGGAGGGTGTGGGGGGGGAGANGVTATNSSGGGAGGAGVSTVTNWGSLSTVLTTTGTGVSGFIAGGGGGSADAAAVGAGGSGGGGAGGKNTSSPPAVSGTANTGSGGGGSTNVAYVAGSGGSGLVIVRYAV
jgi:hypothetical protein